MIIIRELIADDLTQLIDLYKQLDLNNINIEWLFQKSRVLDCASVVTQ